MCKEVHFEVNSIGNLLFSSVRNPEGIIFENFFRLVPPVLIINYMRLLFLSSFFNKVPLLGLLKGKNGARHVQFMINYESSGRQNQIHAK